jgi:uncharacterized protein
MHIKELTNHDCYEVLANCRLGRIACSRENQPYIVPFHFAFDGQSSLYAFSTFGQKIEWMRANPLVCIETDKIINQFEWTSLVIFGHYEELPDHGDFENLRCQAHALLSKHELWWQPAFVSGKQNVERNNLPIYFRIKIDKISGRTAITE